MAKKAYIGVTGAARKVKKGYVGVSNTARKLKKAYIGVGGVARPCWGGGKLTYYGTITPLSVLNYPIASDTNGTHALFFTSNLGDVYSSEFVKQSVTSFSNIWEPGMAYNGAYFVAAHSTNKSGYSAEVTAYNDAFTVFTPTGLCAARRVRDNSASVGSYALFAGGVNVSSAADAYDQNLTRTNPTGLSVGRHYSFGASTKEYGVIASGDTGGSMTATVDVYDRTLTRSTVEGLSVGRQFGGTATNGETILFAGGETYSGIVNTVDVYDASLTRSTISGLSVSRKWVAGLYIDGYYVFSGGYNGSDDPLNVTDVYDESLVHTIGTQLSVGRWQEAAVTLGNYGLFAGGYNATNVDVLTVI